MIEPRSSQAWKSLYAAAMLESDEERFAHRIDMAAAAMKTRLNELHEATSTRSEQTELQSALNYLRRWSDMFTATAGSPSPNEPKSEWKVVVPSEQSTVEKEIKVTVETRCS